MKYFVNFDFHPPEKWPEVFKPVCSKEELERVGEYAQEDDARAFLYGGSIWCD